MEMKQCKFCAEDIKIAAIKCRYCGEETEGSNYFSETLDKYKNWLSKNNKTWSIEKIDKSNNTIVLGMDKLEHNGFVFLILILFFFIPGILYLLFGAQKKHYTTQILINKDGTVEVLGKQGKFLAKNYNAQLTQESIVSEKEINEVITESKKGIKYNFLNKNRSIKDIPLSLKSISLYILSLIFLIGGLGNLGSGLYGISLVFISILLLPEVIKVLRKKFENKNFVIIYITIIFLIFVVSAITI